MLIGAWYFGSKDGADKMNSYWDLPAKPQLETFLTAEEIGLTFPMTGLNVRPTKSSNDPRIIRSKSGKMIGYRALDKISISVKQGDRLGIIGRNGSGKTTLLQVLAGILTPDTGRIMGRGKIDNLINVSFGLQQEATGHRNITLKGLAAGFSRQQIEERREAIALFSELGEFLEMPIVTYSAGMRMRLTFSIATAFSPEILILDEWLSAGDLAFREKATKRMQNFVEKAGILIMASHNKKLLLANSDHIIWLHNGRIHAQGPAETVLEMYEEQQKKLKASAKQPNLRVLAGGS